MQWAAIFAALWKIFGPYIDKVIQAILDKWLNRAAEQLPPADSFKDQADAQRAAIGKAIEILPRFAFARKGLLRRMKAKIGQKITAEDAEELRDLSAAAENE